MATLKNFWLAALLLALLSLTACSKESKTIKSCSFVASGKNSLFEQTRERYQVEYDSLAAGIFIKSIEGITQTRTACWLYYVNSQPGRIASNRYFPTPGDTVEWRLISGY
ncbi:MAG: DUF4430 domain-containing protein [candidate division Zixibacteria bacterium]|nr:DUF4430 domain-containing protein [candidate division Zixibacteria bacterium]